MDEILENMTERNCCGNPGDCACHSCEYISRIYGQTPHCRGCRDINYPLMDAITNEFKNMLEAFRDSNTDEPPLEFEETPVPDESQ